MINYFNHAINRNYNYYSPHSPNFKYVQNAFYQHCPLSTSPISQLPVCYTTVPHSPYRLHCAVQSPPKKLPFPLGIPIPTRNKIILGPTPNPQLQIPNRHYWRTSTELLLLLFVIHWPKLTVYLSMLIDACTACILWHAKVSHKLAQMDS